LASSQWQPPPRKVSGFIEANEIRVGSRVGGRVLKVFVEEGQPVKKDKPLVSLEPYDLEEQLAQSQAILAARQAELDKLKCGNRPLEIAQAEERSKQLAAVLKKLEKGPREQEIRSAEASLQQADALLKLAQEKKGRMDALIAKNAGTREDLDQANSELKVAQTTQKVRQAELDLLNAGTRPEEIEEAQARLKEAQLAWELLREGYRREEITAAEAAVKAAEAAVAVFKRQLAELTILSPVDGFVEAVELEPGDLVGANSPTVSLLDSSELWVRAYVPENQMGIKIGHKVAVTIDSFPGREFAGHVSYIARQAEFTPGNVQTAEDRSKQVFRIKVLMDDGLKELRAGMSADIWLDRVPATGKESPRS
jgi:HlyD family secretion protein